MQDKKTAPTLTAGEQAILDRITQERIKADNHVNSLIEELRAELKAERKEDKCKLNALQKGVSNLQSVKKDMNQVKKDVGEMKQGIEQLQDDVDTVTSDYGFERDENGKLIPDKS